MKIKRITIENFRNFKDRSVIECSTDGKVTIIYGKNGDGKTTLHQFFRWMFYNDVHFNKTTTGRLYNLELESKAGYNDRFTVYGCIEFDHDGRQYSLTRTAEYQKGLSGSTQISSNLDLMTMGSDNDWTRIDKPDDTIEKLIPSGLSDYFFFDGESMIADLRTTGRDSAGKLKKALFSIFDLDAIEAAINHIGRTDLRTTVLGKLFLDKGAIFNDQQLNTVQYQLQQAQDKVEEIGNRIEENNKKSAELQELIKELSEKIGNSKSKEEYENERKKQKQNQALFIKNAEAAQSAFGDSVVDIYPKLLISKAVRDAGAKIHMQVEKYRLPSGINKALISYLLDSETKTCVCGNLLCKQSREHISEFLNYMPPRSYASLYNNFKRTAEGWGKEYNPDSLSKFIKNVIENEEAAEKCDEEIRRIDDQEKASPDITQLVIDRKKAEEQVEENSKENETLAVEKKKFEALVGRLMKQMDEMRETTKSGKETKRKIEIMQTVLDYFTQRLSIASKTYSEELQLNIQELVNRMLTSTRKVSVSKDFAVTITDSYQDESKSEGQFAVVSFAYIGGIFKMLKENQKLKNKEYPLVLDGPFSKLDEDQRKNVTTTIPEFAPQIILFSKDNLQNVFPSGTIGKVWTIKSNNEKNVASVKEGFLW